MAPTRTVDFLLSRTLSKLQGVERQAAALFAMLSRSAADPALGAHCQARREAALRRLALIEAYAAPLPVPPTSRKCLVMEGMTEEAAELIEEIRPGAALDAGIRLAARRATRWEDGMLADARELAVRADRPGVSAWLATLHENASTGARAAWPQHGAIVGGPMDLRLALDAGKGGAIIARAPAGIAEDEAAQAAAFPVPGDARERDLHLLATGR
jgi:ferritin-like metal-binding protein YciE